MDPIRFSIPPPIRLCCQCYSRKLTASTGVYNLHISPTSAPQGSPQRLGPRPCQSRGSSQAMGRSHWARSPEAEADQGATRTLGCASTPQPPFNKGDLCTLLLWLEGSLGGAGGVWALRTLRPQPKAWFSVVCLDVDVQQKIPATSLHALLLNHAVEMRELHDEAQTTGTADLPAMSGKPKTQALRA